MTYLMRSSGVILLILLVGACTRVGHIQQTTPVKTLNFTGSAKEVASCVQLGLGGQMMYEPGDRYIIYNSVKRAQAADGITHYSVTVAPTAANQGTAAWRVVLAPPDTAVAGKPPSSAPKGGTLGFPDSTVLKYWGPVERCAAQAKGGSS